ncbi:MAG: hypothetical protein BGN86_14275 [Caulobacterales bacterium 68-7]|nr:MAG: hypothetical protein BGN86_14275 [Caulobacterales bacterium 68-7]
MFDDFVDRLTSRLMAGAGLIVAAAIAAVAGAMAIYTFLAASVGAAWAYTIVAATAAVIVFVWRLLHQGRRKTRKLSIDDKILATLYARPPAAFLAGLAAATLAKGKPGEALQIWKASRMSVKK